ncbi:putative teichuronic acid biosynthesis glycosyltransferase TuaH [compost metagenome]
MQKFTVIYTPTLDYNFMQQRPQRIMEQFARAGHQVYFINMNENNQPPEVVEPNLTVLHSHEQIFSVEKKYPVVLWMSWAKTHDWIEKLNPDIALYDCLDDFADWREFEKVIVTKVDLITTTAEKLYDKMALVHNEVVMVKNACEYEHFYNVNSSTDANDWPKEYNNQIVGYVGALGHWVDSDLLMSLADDFKIVLIGPEFGMKPIKHQNIVKLGMKDYSTLPSYIKKMDVLIIPFLLNDITTATNPIKMYEYLATGKPVVTTALPEAKLYGEVYSSNNNDEFIKLVKQAMNGNFNANDLITNRKTIAVNNSWKNRYNVAYNKICEVFNKKRG